MVLMIIQAILTIVKINIYYNKKECRLAIRTALQCFNKESKKDNTPNNEGTSTAGDNEGEKTEDITNLPTDNKSGDGNCRWSDIRTYWLGSGYILAIIIFNIVFSLLFLIG